MIKNNSYTQELRFGDNDAAIVDAEDYHRFNRYTWFWTTSGVTTIINGHRDLLHRLILDVSDDEVIVHLNNNKRDCRRANLTVVDRGYAALVDRDVYGIRSVLPIIQRLKATSKDDNREPTSREDAEALKRSLLHDSKQIEALFSDTQSQEHLSKKDYLQYRADLNRIKEGRLRNYRRVCQWRIPRDTETGRSLTTLPPEVTSKSLDKIRERIAARGIAAFGHLDLTDTDTLMHLVCYSLQRLGRRLEWEDIELEKTVLDYVRLWLNERGYADSQSATAKLLSEG